MNRLIVLFLVGCGSAQHLQSTCTTNDACEVGEICSAGACVKVAADDPGPKPATSAELIERLGTSELTIKDAQNGTVSLVVSDPAQTTSVAWPLALGDLHAKVSGTDLTVWGLALHGDGGAVGSPPVYVQNLTLTAADPVIAPIVTDAYPRAHATVLLTLHVTADVGSDPTQLSTVAATVDAMPLDLNFALDAGALSVDLALGDSRALIDLGSAFRLGALNAATHLLGAQVPASWQ